MLDDPSAHGELSIGVVYHKDRIPERSPGRRELGDLYAEQSVERTRFEARRANVPDPAQAEASPTTRGT